MIKFVTAALKNHDEETGFSLVELIVVVAILGILVIVAIPVYGGIQKNAERKALQVTAANAATRVAAALANGETASSVLAAYQTDYYAGRTTLIYYSAVDTSPTGPGQLLEGMPKPKAGEKWNESADEVYIFVGTYDGTMYAGAGSAGPAWNNWD